jgi:hypothetical protein
MNPVENLDYYWNTQTQKIIARYDGDWKQLEEGYYWMRLEGTWHIVWLDSDHDFWKIGLEQLHEVKHHIDDPGFEIFCLPLEFDRVGDWV